MDRRLQLWEQCVTYPLTSDYEFIQVTNLDSELSNPPLGPEFHMPHVALKCQISSSDITINNISVDDEFVEIPKQGTGPGIFSMIFLNHMHKSAWSLDRLKLMEGTQLLIILKSAAVKEFSITGVPDKLLYEPFCVATNHKKFHFNVFLCIA